MADPDEALTASAAEVEAAQKAMGCERSPERVRDHRDVCLPHYVEGCGKYREPETTRIYGWTDRGCPVAVAVADAVVAAAQPRGYERWEYGVERGPFGDKFPAHIEWGSSDGMSHHYEYTAENVHALASGRPVFRRLRTSFPDVLGEPEPFPSADDIEA